MPVIAVPMPSASDKGDGLLAHQHQQKNDREGEKSRHLAQALQDTDLDAGKAGLLDRKVIDHRLPGGKADRHRRGKQVEKEFGFLQLLL
jgi:hypothetical protein